MTLKEFEVLFPDDESIIKYYIQIRYNGVLTCSHCGSTNKMSTYRNKPKKFQCNICNNTFSVFKDTIFEYTKIPLVTWFYVIRIFLNSKTGDSAYNVQRETGVSYPTAWRMLKQIRIAMDEPDLLHSFSGIVEIDETYHGGKPRLIPNNDLNPNYKRGKRGRGTSKKPLLGMLGRENGKLHITIAEPNKNGQKLTSKQIKEPIFRYFDMSKLINVFTDDYNIYNFLDTGEYSNINHESVKHSAFQYTNGRTKNGDLIHTNGIENCWGTLKSTLWGTYRKRMTDKYLQSYLNEVSFRYNNCKDLKDEEGKKIYKNRYMNAVDKLLKNSIFLKEDNNEENNEDKEVDENEYVS